MTTLRAISPPRPAPPLIGVVTHELRAEADPAWAATPGRSERDVVPARLALRLSYTQAVQEAGALAVVLPAHGYVDDTAALLDRLDGLVFSGGPDRVGVQWHAELLTHDPRQAALLGGLVDAARGAARRLALVA